MALDEMKTRSEGNCATNSTQSGFAELMAELRDGSESAATQLVDQYAPYILRAVRRTLNHEIRAKFDSIDFAQAVWCSVFAKPTKLHDIQTPEQLIRLLSAMSRNKVIDEIRRRMETQKHDVRRERQYAETTAAVNEGVASREPSPSQVAIVREEWKRMLDELPPQHREVLALRLKGRTHESIAKQLNISPKTVQRVLRTARE